MTTTRSGARTQEQKERQRELQRRNDVERAEGRLRDRRRRIGLRVGGVIVALVAVALAVGYALRGTSSTSTPVLGADLGRPDSTVASPPTSGFTRVGTPLMAGGKPELLFVGAQYCPHCAGQRWPVIKALSQFGTFSGLAQSVSSEGNVPTFDLLHATFTSSYVAFDHKDVQDGNHNNLQSLTPSEQTLFSRYDTTGSIPLVLVGGYAVNGDAYNLSDVLGMSFAQVQGALQRGRKAPIVTDINGEANAITAFVCHANGMRPASACARHAVRTIIATLH